MADDLLLLRTGDYLLLRGTDRLILRTTGGASAVPIIAQLIEADQMFDIVTKDSTNRSVTIRIIDSSDGTPETGVEHDTSGIDLWYRRELAAKTSITEAALAALTTAHTDGGIEHIGDGYYRLDLPDAAFATGAEYVEYGGTVTGMIVIGGRIRLADVDLEDSVRGGMTALPNAAADAAGGLPISDAGGLDLDTMDSNVTAIVADTNELQTDWANGGRLDLIVDAILVDTAEIGAAGAGLTEAGGTGDQLTALATAAALATVDGNVDSILVDTGTTLPAVLGTPIDFGSGTSTLAANLQDMADNGTATFDRSTDSLQAIRDNGDSAWVTGPTAAAIRAEIDSNSTQLAAIVADTNELQTDWANGGRLDLIIDAILVDTAEIGAAGAGLTEAGGTGDHLTALALSSAGAIAVADAMLIRDVDNVEGSANEHTLCTIVLAMLESSISSTTWTIKRTDGSTTHATKTLTVDANADPVTGVS